MTGKSTWYWRLAAAAAALCLYLFIAPVQAGINQAVAVLARGDLAAVREYMLTFGWWGPVVSILLMVLQALVLPLPAFIITFTNAWLYGWVWGAVLSWSGAMLAAALCYGLARWFGRPLVVRLVGSNNLAMADGFFERYGTQAVLVARLIPVVSFDLISYAAGLTSVRFWSFVIATGVGQLPATLVYSYLGQSLGGQAQVIIWGLSLAFILLVVGWSWRLRLTRQKAPAQATSGDQDNG